MTWTPLANAWGVLCVSTVEEYRKQRNRQARNRTGQGREHSRLRLYPRQSFQHLQGQALQGFEVGSDLVVGAFVEIFIRCHGLYPRSIGLRTMTYTWLPVETDLQGLWPGLNSGQLLTSLG